MTSGRVAVVVPTRGPAVAVEGCVAALVGHGLAESVEVVVVDNGAHPTVTAPPSVRVVHEPRPGASSARNRGVAVLADDVDVVAFVDDDVRVDADWLDRLVAPFVDPGVDAVVGPVVLDVVDRPRWFTPALEHWWSGLDLGPEDRLLGAGEYGWGANLAVRRGALVAVGGFDRRLGPGTAAGFGDDTDLLDRLRARGGRVRYAAGARVSHVVGPERRSRRWLRARARAAGRAEVAVDRLRHGAPARRRPLRAVRTLAGALRRGPARFVAAGRDPDRHPGRWVELEAQWSARAGAAGAWWRPDRSVKVPLDGADDPG